MHTPVLLHEVIEFLDPKPGKFIIDGTIDGGGHSAEIFEKILPNGKLLGLDWDSDLLEIARSRISAKIKNQNSPKQNKFATGQAKLKNLILTKGNYAELDEILQERKLPKADGLLLDLGFSSEQLETSGRGFSFSPSAGGEPLLMTYDPNRAPVKTLLRQLNEKELADIIFKSGGERFSRRIAKAIREAEKKRKIETSGELADVIRNSVPRNYERGRIDPATRTFQALRIYANDELGNLENILSKLPEILKNKARVAIITFHSLEDKIVKNYFRELQKKGLLEILTKKPIVPQEEEINSNPRSRSAKLRAAKII